MISEELNIKYIREKTGLVKDDELIPIILEMIKDSYKAGLCQAEHDNTMDLIEENKQLKEQNERLLELCMYALISPTKIYNHELADNTKQVFKDIIKNNLECDTFTLREKIKYQWYKGE